MVLLGLAAPASAEAPAGTSVTSLIAVLTGVTATSSRQAWAVGWTDMFSQSPQPVILRWNGTSWRRVGGLRPAAAFLQSVAAISAADAWAVGYSHGALIMHWSGGKWRRASSPSEGTGSKLLGVAAPSARSAFAVGCVSCVIGGGSEPLVLAWNGRTWRRARLPHTGAGSELLGVAATSARNAWAVGCTHCGAAGTKVLLLRWNGTAWRAVPLPSGVSAGSLSGVAALSAGAAWAVGCSKCGFLAGESLILRWNGHAWRRVPVPATGASNQLSGVTVQSARSAWAVGSGGKTGFGVPKTLIFRWNGSAWKRAPSPSDGSNGGALVSVVATSGRNAWAVGNNFNDEAQTLIVAWNGRAWKLS